MARGHETLETEKFPFEIYLILEKRLSFFDYQWGEPELGKSDRKLRAKELNSLHQQLGPTTLLSAV